jgi:hypothetical protein
MVLTGAVAAITEVVMFRTPAESIDPWWATIRLVFSTGYGLALTGLVVLVGEVAQGRFAQFAPGHLMILLGAAGAIADGGIYIALHYFVKRFWWPAWQPEYTFWLLHQSVGYLVIGLVWTCCIPMWGVPRRWTLGFAALALLLLSQGAINFWLLLQLLGHAPVWLTAAFPTWWIFGASIVCTLVLVSLIVADWRARQSYDWLHWASIMLSLALAANQWLRFVKEEFFTPR